MIHSHSDTLLIIILLLGIMVGYSPSTEASKIIPEDVFLGQMASPPKTTTTTTNERGKSRGNGTHSTLLEPIIIHHKGKGGGGVRSGRPDGEGAGLCQGACIPPRSCDYHGGTPHGHCLSGSICCQFERSCGGVSREKISYFKSPDYPSALNYSLHCNYQIYANADVCALRIEFLEFKLSGSTRTSKVEKCVSDALYILNTDGGANEPICDMENHTAIVYLNQGEEGKGRPLQLLIVAQSSPVKWNLKITQLNCLKVKPWTNVEGCGRQLMYDSSGPTEGSDEGDQPIHNALIVNGADAEMREFPWQVSIQVMPRGSHRCGASVLNSRYILTAAHCLLRSGYEARDRLKIIVGDYRLNGTEDGAHKQFHVDSVIVHWHYKPQESHLNDIALIKVKEEMEFNGKVQPICLPTSPSQFQVKKGGGGEAWISGWGRLNGTDPAAKANTLQKLRVTLLEDERCRELVREELEEILHRNISDTQISHFAKLGTSETQLCAQPPLHSAVCFGDSGGPLVVQNEEDGRFVQIGIVSYGLGKCITERNPPAAYTRVSRFLQFIALAVAE